MDKTKLSKESSQFCCGYEKKGFIGVLTFAGILTKTCAQELNTPLIDAIVDADFVVVNLDQVTSIDSDCFSLFCMASRMAYSVNKRLHLGRATHEQRIAATRMCSPPIISRTDRPDCATCCFWLDRTSEDGANAITDMQGN